MAENQQQQQQQQPVDTKYLPELMAEKDSIDPSFVHAVRLISNEINRVKNPSEEKASTGAEKELIEAHGGKPTKVALCIKVPIERYPNFNFVGRLLGPGGSTLKGIQSSTSTQIAILGKGSMRDKKKQEELAAGGDSKYQHLNHPLHVRISCLAALDQAYIQIGHAATEVVKLMQPTPEDEVMDSTSHRGGTARGRGGRGSAAGGRGGSGRGAGRGSRGGASQRGTASGRTRGAAAAGRGYAAKAQDPYAAQSGYEYGMDSYEGYGSEYADPYATDAYGAEAYVDPYATDGSYATDAYGTTDTYAAYGDGSYDAYGNGAEAVAQYAAPAAKSYRGKMRGAAAGRGRASAKPY